MEVIVGDWRLTAINWMDSINETMIRLRNEKYKISYSVRIKQTIRSQYDNLENALHSKQWNFIGDEYKPTNQIIKISINSKNLNQIISLNIVK